MASKDFLLQPSDQVVRAANFIVEGGIGAVPTETVYGLAGNAFNLDAIRRIFEVKQRPLNDPLIIHISSIEMAQSLAYFNDLAKLLAKAFWAGPLTMVLPKKDCVDDLLTAGKKTVAIRMPEHNLMRQLIDLSNCPLAAPSANPFGYISPTCAKHVEEQLGDKIDFILDGGDCRCGVESTIVLVDDGKINILRAGPISAKEISDVVGLDVEILGKTSDEILAPGMLSSHYSPNATLKLFSDISEIPQDFAGGIIFMKKPEIVKENYYWLSEDGDLSEVAHNLFATLRSLDSRYRDLFYAQVVPNLGIGVAINDRLFRASTKKI